jgi:hypothetical protein
LPTNSIAGKVTNLLFSAHGSLLGDIGAYLPIQKVYGALSNYSQYSQVVISLPALTIVAEGGGFAVLVLPDIDSNISGSTNELVSFTGTLPSLILTSSALQQSFSGVFSSLPAIKILSTGYSSNLAEFLKSIPAIRLTSSGSVNIFGELSKSFPDITLDSSAHWTGLNIASLVLPSIGSVSYATFNDIIVLALNTQNFSITTYDNYGYNSLCCLNGKMLGAKGNGIYELSGDTDNGDSIAWSFKTGKLDTSDNFLNKIRYAWITYRPSGDLMLEVDDGENIYEYDVESYQQIDNSVKIKFGRGIRNRYIQLELRNVSNEKIFLDGIKLFAEHINKKR